MLIASHFELRGLAAIDRHRLTDNEPYIYRTRDAANLAKDHKRSAGRVYMQNVTETRSEKGCSFAAPAKRIVSFDEATIGSTPA